MFLAAFRRRTLMPQLSRSSPRCSTRWCSKPALIRSRLPSHLICAAFWAVSLLQWAGSSIFLVPLARSLLLKRSKQSGRLFWLCWSRLLLQCTFRFLPTLFQTFSSEFHIAYINASMADSLTCASFVSVDYSAETKLH